MTGEGLDKDRCVDICNLTAIGCFETGDKGKVCDNYGNTLTESHLKHNQGDCVNNDLECCVITLEKKNEPLWTICWLNDDDDEYQVFCDEFESDKTFEDYTVECTCFAQYLTLLLVILIALF